MSHQVNEAWLEVAKMNFEEACTTENWPLARAIIADVGDIDEKAAMTLEREIERLQTEQLNYDH